MKPEPVLTGKVVLADGLPAEPYQLVRDLEDGSLWRIRAVKEEVGFINLLEYGKACAIAGIGTTTTRRASCTSDRKRGNRMDLAKAIHDAEKADPGFKVKDLFKGDCRGCGQCCSRFLPLSPFDIKRIYDHVTEHGISQRPEASEADLMCPYIDLESGECRIYPARPDICRGYRCDLHAKGDTDAVSAFMFHGPYFETDLRDLDLPRKEGDQ